MKDKLNLETRILDLVLHQNYQPLKPKAIAKKLKLLGEEREVKRTIKRLIKKGRLAYGPKHLVMKPPVEGAKKGKSKKTKNTETSSNAATGKKNSKLKDDEVIGTFRRAGGGFGFVNPTDSVATDRSDDVFVPQLKTLDAADRDLVKVRITSRRGPKVAGRIVEVIERHTHRFVGTYSESNDLGVVTVDGGIFDSAILVGDAGAKNGRVGDKVVIEMANFPSEYQPGEAVIVEILGDRGQPGVDTLSVIRQFGLPEEFPERVLEDARRQADAFDEDDIEGRTDFTQTTVITIDPKTARDFDDAISLEQLENGHWELGVHIADVSHFVPYRSDLDDEAFARATSIYLPDRVIPMIPEIISNNLASLQPDRVRYCMTALIEFTEDGVHIGTELHRGAIKSAQRFDYEEIDDYLENDRPWKKKLTPKVFSLVRNMHTLAMTLRERRMKAGAINLVLPEVKIDLDEDGRVAGAHTVDHTESHQVIEEFMLAANEAVARHLDDLDLFYLRRIHPSPSEQKVKQLTSFVQALGLDCRSLLDRFEVKRIVEESEGMPECHAIHFAVLRSMQKAVYSPEQIGHYALNSNNYCHFTSPIRRYPDLIIHRMVGDLIDGKRPDANFDRLAMLGKHCSELEKRATDAERDLTKLKLLNFLSDRVGKKMEAVITGVESFGLFAQGIEIPAEGLIPVETLPLDSYRFERDTRTLSGHKPNNEFRLGDIVTITVAVVDPDQRLLEFDYGGRGPGRRKIDQKSPASGRGRDHAKRSNHRDEKPSRKRGSSKPRSGKAIDSKKASSGEKGSGAKPKSRSKSANAAKIPAGKAKSPRSARKKAAVATTQKTSNGKSSGAKPSGKQSSSSKAGSKSAKNKTPKKSTAKQSTSRKPKSRKSTK